MGIIKYNITQWQRELRKSESVVSMVQDTVLPSERSLRNSKSVSTLPTCPHSAVKTVSKDKLLASGDANIPTRRLLEVLINLLPPPPSLPKLPFNVSEDREKRPNW